MAYSYIEYVGDGSTKTFNIPFTYLKQADVKVYVGGVNTAFTFTSANIASLASAPASGVVVRVARATDASARAVDFQDGSVLSESDLDTSADQVFKISQEAIDRANEAVAKDVDGVFDAQSRRIKNLADPVNAKDAVNRSWAETGMTSQLNQATAKASEAASSASTATTKASEAATSATNAAASASTAGTKATEASSSATTATTKASEASLSASTATTKAGEATASASTATTKATEAASSASAASSSATSASSSATSASNSATAAAGSASTATTKASEASTSATNASGSASAASTAASAAFTYKSEAATKALEASGSASAAASSAAEASLYSQLRTDVELGVTLL